MLAAPTAQAQRGRKSSGKAAKAQAEAKTESNQAAAKPLSEPERRLLTQTLVGSNTEAAEAAAQRLGESGQESATEALTEALSLGTYPHLAAPFLRALGKLNHAKGLQIIALYAGHRDPKVRLAATEALAQAAADGAAGILLERLGDQDERVREAAATALANRKDTRAVDRLLMLVRRSDAGAATALGQLAPLEMAPQVAELRGSVTDATLAAVLGEFLKRPEAPDRLRIDLVQTLGRVPGADATTALVEYLATVPADEARPSKEAAEALIEQRSRL